MRKFSQNIDFDSEQLFHVVTQFCAMRRYATVYIQAILKIGKNTQVRPE